MKSECDTTLQIREHLQVFKMAAHTMTKKGFGNDTFGQYCRRSCSTTHKNFEDLKVSLEGKWAKIPQDSLCVTVVSFKCRLNPVVQAKGNHTEKKYVWIK